MKLKDIGSVWARDLVIVLQKYDSPLLNNLYDYVKKYRRDTGRTWNNRMEATVRMTLQRHCRKCSQYQGRHDLFENLANGCWRLRPDLKIS